MLLLVNHCAARSAQNVKRGATMSHTTRKKSLAKGLAIAIAALGVTAVPARSSHATVVDGAVTNCCDTALRAAPRDVRAGGDVHDAGDEYTFEAVWVARPSAA
jgi:hypothetical protein